MTLKRKIKILIQFVYILQVKASPEAVKQFRESLRQLGDVYINDITCVKPYGYNEVYKDEKLPVNIGKLI